MKKLIAFLALLALPLQAALVPIQPTSWTTNAPNLAVLSKTGDITGTNASFTGTVNIGTLHATNEIVDLIETNINIIGANLSVTNNSNVNNLKVTNNAVFLTGLTSGSIDATAINASSVSATLADCHTSGTFHFGESAGGVPVKIENVHGAYTPEWDIDATESSDSTFWLGVGTIDGGGNSFMEQSFFIGDSGTIHDNDMNNDVVNGNYYFGSFSLTIDGSGNGKNNFGWQCVNNGHNNTFLIGGSAQQDNEFRSEMGNGYYFDGGGSMHGNGQDLTNQPYAKTFTSTNGYFTFTKNVDGSTNVAFTLTNIGLSTLNFNGNGSALTNLNGNTLAITATNRLVFTTVSSLTNTLGREATAIVTAGTSVAIQDTNGVSIATIGTIATLDVLVPLHVNMRLSGTGVSAILY